MTRPYKYTTCYYSALNKRPIDKEVYYEATCRETGFKCFVHKSNDQIFHPYGWYATYSSTPWLHNQRDDNGGYSRVVKQLRVPGTFKTRDEAAQAGCKIRRLEELAFGGYAQSGLQRIKYLNDFFSATCSWVHRRVNLRVLRELIKHQGKVKTRAFF